MARAVVARSSRAVVVVSSVRLVEVKRSRAKEPPAAPMAIPVQFSAPARTPPATLTEACSFAEKRPFLLKSIQARSTPVPVAERLAAGML